jgi:hypothetical protein
MIMLIKSQHLSPARSTAFLGSAVRLLNFNLRQNRDILRDCRQDMTMRELRESRHSGTHSCLRNPLSGKEPHPSLNANT